MFRYPYLPTAQPMFRHPYVPTAQPLALRLLNLCSDNPMFRQPALKIVLALDWCGALGQRPAYV